MAKIIYYTCEQDDIDHNFKTVELRVSRILYEQAQVCKRCGSIFDFGYLGTDIKKALAQLSGMDLSQYLLKEATKTNQAVMHAKAMARAARSTPEGEANLREIIGTLATAEDRAKGMPNASPWRMNG